MSRLDNSPALSTLYLIRYIKYDLIKLTNLLGSDAFARLGAFSGTSHIVRLEPCSLRALVARGALSEPLDIDIQFY